MKRKTKTKSMKIKFTIKDKPTMTSMRFCSKNYCCSRRIFQVKKISMPNLDDEYGRCSLFIASPDFFYPRGTRRAFESSLKLLMLQSQSSMINYIENYLNLLCNISRNVFSDYSKFMLNTIAFQLFAKFSKISIFYFFIYFHR